MKTFRRILKWSAAGVAGLALLGAVLHQFFGLRVEMNGAGFPRVSFTPGADEQAMLIAEHRESQRAKFADVPPGPTSSSLPADAGPETRTAASAVPTSLSPGPDWTDFRGPLRDGIYRQGPIRVDWPLDGLVPIWKQPGGGGYASFTIAGGRAFTIEQRGAEEVVAAYDVATGREIWTNAWGTVFRETLGGDGPRATPTWAGGLVYALGGEGELRCLDDRTGALRWRTNVLTDASASNVTWGMSASPLVIDDTVIVLPGGSGGRSVVAYDRNTGKPAWSSLGNRQAYVSPMLITLLGVRQILVLSAERLMGLTPDRGELLWEFPWTTYNDINVAQPILIGDSRIFISSSYGTGAAVIELTRVGDRFTPREVWRNTRMKNRFTSSVLHEGFIYGLDEAILACLDPATGELKWKGGRYGYGQVLLASGHLIVLTEDGELALVRATPQRHEEVARFPVLNGKTWNHPALAGGYLLVRNLAEMAAFDLRAPTPSRQPTP